MSPSSPSSHRSWSQVSSRKSLKTHTETDCYSLPYPAPGASHKSQATSDERRIIGHYTDSRMGCSGNSTQHVWCWCVLVCAGALLRCAGVCWCVLLCAGVCWDVQESGEWGGEQEGQAEARAEHGHRAGPRCGLHPRLGGAPRLLCRLLRRGAPQVRRRPVSPQSDLRATHAEQASRATPSSLRATGKL